jgi:Ca2+-binding EF-hand superfamily protein
MSRPLAGAILSIIFLLCGCSTSHHHNTEDSAKPKEGPSSIIYSPNGEPLNGGENGRPTCEEAMSRWFDRIDINHDHLISRDEFLADAETQFHRMDIDNNGYLVSEELERFRLPYRQQATTQATASKQNDATDQQKNQHKHGHGDESGAQTDSSHQSDQKDFPDPVMSADTNNDFKVTLNEFITQAGNKFIIFDADHNGLLTQDEILKSCSASEK